MKDYHTLTREKVNADPTAAKYFTSETHLMQDWSDKMLDLVLNGPTLNSFPKVELRAMLRETYTALKRYETIGVMASPFLNDPAAIVAQAFAELYPGVDCIVQYDPNLHGDEDGTGYAETCFPDDGSTPIISVSTDVPVGAVPELLAHEYAHVAVGYEVEHGPEWKAAEEAIAKKYDEILAALIPGDPVEISVTPHKVGDGGIIALPLKDNIPDPHDPRWTLTTCPVCGAECWEPYLAKEALAAEPELRVACTVCALKAGERREP